MSRVSHMAATLLLLVPLCCSAQSRSLIVSPAASQPAKEQRIALVIGNGRYDAPLRNPVNDARAIAAELRDAGFAVTLVLDASYEQLGEAVRVFGDELRKGGVGVFYFAGHGVQIAGRNYLIPVSSRIEREDEVIYHSLDAGQVLQKMATAGNRLNVVILDACRSNPFARSFRSLSTGLAVMEAPSNTLIAFATSPGSVASDGNGDHGLYTQYLLKNMPVEGLRIEDMFKRVRAGVRQESAGRQLPWENTSLEVEFYLRPLATQVEPSPAAPTALAVELAFWDAIKDSSEWADFDAYLRKYPSGQFAELAKNRLRALRPPPVAVAPPAPPTPAPEVISAPENVFAPGEITSTAIALAPNGGYAVSAARDGIVSIWEVTTTKELRRFFGHAGAVFALAISADSQFIATGGEDTAIRVWSFSGGAELKRLSTDSVVTALAFAPNGLYLVSGHRNGKLYMWDMRSGKRISELAANATQVNAVSFSQNGRYVLVGTADGYVRVWDGRKALLYGPHAFGVVAARLSANGETLISASADGVVWAWDMSTRKHTLRVAAQQKSHALVALSDDGGKALVARDDGISMLWDVQAGRELKRFNSGAAPVTAVTLSSEARHALVAADGQKIRLWALKE